MEEGVENLSRNLKQILTNVRAHSNQDDVVKKPGKYLGPAIKIYADFLSQNNLSNFEEFMQKVRIDGRNNADLQKAVEELWTIEEIWDDFLQNIIGQNKVCNLLTPRFINYTAQLYF